MGSGLSASFGRARSTTAAKPPPNATPELLVATLNCMGQGLNPFEFLSSANAAGCEELQKVAAALTYEAFVAACGDTVLTADAAPTGGTEALEALKAHCDGGQSLWEEGRLRTAAVRCGLWAPTGPPNWTHLTPP